MENCLSDCFFLPFSAWLKGEEGVDGRRKTFGSLLDRYRSSYFLFPTLIGDAKSKVKVKDCFLVSERVPTLLDPSDVSSRHKSFISRKT